MTFEHKPGTFSLFRNDKQGNDKRPDYTGTGADEDGNPIRVSAWLKEGKNGKFMSCRIERKDERQETGHERQQRKAAPEPKESVSFDADDDIPF